MSENDPVFDRIRMILIERFNVTPHIIDYDTHLRDDLDLDSLDIETLFEHMEEEFGHGFAGVNTQDKQTIKDLVDIFY